MKKENCPFCGHRWIRKSSESTIECPSCGTEYFVEQAHHEQFEREEPPEEEEDSLVDELEERNA